MPDASRPLPVEADSRGILAPALLRQRIRLQRYPVPAGLAGLIDRFWTVEWALPDGLSHRQDVLTHPGANLSVGTAAAGTGIEARLYGVARALSSRLLRGAGWTVAAMTRPGGLGPFVAGPAASYTDRVVPLGAAVGLDEPELIRQLSEHPTLEGRVAAFAQALQSILDRTDPASVAGALTVTELARAAETDRSLQRVEQLAALAGVGVRNLQRLFREHAGVSPTWVLRRYRLLDAAELVRDGRPVNWAEVAQLLGYADQAHLIREFRSAIGQTPAAYAAAQVPS